MNYPRLFLLLVFFVFAVSFIKCNSKEDKGEYKNTIVVCDSVYIEVYRTFGSGALGGDIISEYITDSVNYRFYIGDFDNSTAHYSFTCNGDSIRIDKMYKSDSSNEFSLKETNQYRILDFKYSKNISKPSIDKLNKEKNE